MLTNQEIKRYERHLSLKGFGKDAQEKLKAARVLVIGAGGLGCPVLQYLVAAGVGEIGIIDDDVVSESNLQRQVLYTANDIGKKKAEVASEKLHALNPLVKIVAFTERFSPANAIRILKHFDIVVDGSDNFETRYLVSDATYLLKKPLVFGAIFRFEGQVSVFNVPVNEEQPVNYRCVFPEKDRPADSLNCAEAGVLGVLPGIIGTLQASETIKLIAGIGETLEGKLLVVDALTIETKKFNLSFDPASLNEIPGNKEELEKKKYSSATCETMTINSITPIEFADKLNSVEAPVVIDVRAIDEHPDSELECVVIPHHLIGDADLSFADGKEVVLFCKGGVRSAEAYKRIIGKCKASKIYSLEGGILNWHKFQEEKNSAQIPQ